MQYKKIADSKSGERPWLNAGNSTRTWHFWIAGQARTGWRTGLTLAVARLSPLQFGSGSTLPQCKASQRPQLNTTPGGCGALCPHLHHPS
eukprot:3403721-Rhodomonas_salina.1